MFALALGLAFATSALAKPQQQSQSPQNQQSQQNQSGAITPAIPQEAKPATGAQSQAQQPQPPKIDPAEEAAYKAFAGMLSGTADAANKQIQAGKDFLAKYPKSGYTVAVYNQLVNDYYKDAQGDQDNSQDLNNLYAASDKALELEGNDLDVLVLTGWVIPHFYNRNDLDADQKLDKAEAYERRALQIIPQLTKPANLTDQQFADEKQAAASQAHSGLGLVLFRKQDIAGSVTELQQATSGPQPDPTDLFVLGIEQKALKHYPEAAAAFQKCGAIPGALETRCQDQAKALPAQPAPAAHN